MFNTFLQNIRRLPILTPTSRLCDNSTLKSTSKHMYRFRRSFAFRLTLSLILITVISNGCISNVNAILELANTTPPVVPIMTGGQKDSVNYDYELRDFNHDKTHQENLHRGIRENHYESQQHVSTFNNNHKDTETPNRNEFFEYNQNESHLHMDKSENYSSVSSPSKTSYQMMPIYGYVLSAILLLIIWIVGTSGNFLVIYLVATNKQLQTPMNLFLVNLSIADFTMAGLGSPISFTAAILGGWPFGDTVCVIYAFGMALGGITSIITLMVLAFERFLMIARPFRAADIQNQHSICIIIGVWMFSLALTTPPLFGWASYGPEAAHISCSVNWETDDIGTTTYIVFLFALGLVLPLTTIMFSYFGILVTIRQTGQQGTTSTSATRRAELRVVGMVATMVSSFMLAWSPYAILSLLVAFSQTYRKQITPFIAVLPSIFAKSSSCYNPIIYVGLNTQFRTAWQKLFGLERPQDDEGTALTLSATAGIPKAVSKSYAQIEKNSPDPDFEIHVESSFISKESHLKSRQFENENLVTTPLLQGNGSPVIEMSSEEQRNSQTPQHYQHNVPEDRSTSRDIAEQTLLIPSIQPTSNKTQTNSEIPTSRSFSDGFNALEKNGHEGSGCIQKRRNISITLDPTENTGVNDDGGNGFMNPEEQLC